MLYGVIILVKIGKYRGFCVYRRPYLVWSPVTVVVVVPLYKVPVWCAPGNETGTIAATGTIYSARYYGGPWLTGPNIVSKNGKMYKFLCIP